MLTKNIKTSVWDSEYYKLSGIHPPQDESKSELPPKSAFKFSTILIIEAVILWLVGLGFITYMVMRSAF